MVFLYFVGEVQQAVGLVAFFEKCLTVRVWGDFPLKIGNIIFMPKSLFKIPIFSLFSCAIQFFHAKLKRMG
jgi:hypothetical protein